MAETNWFVWLLLAGVLAYPFVRRWRRRRLAAKMADRLLADVVKGKDSFRR